MIDLTQFGIYKEDGREHEEIIYSVALIYNLINTELSHFLTQYGLTPSKLNILVSIRHHGGQEGLPQVEVSKHLIVTPSNMTKMLDKLQAEGLVTRSAAPNDRRINLVKVTDKAIALLDTVWPEYDARLKELVSGMTKPQARQLADFLTGWFGAIKEKFDDDKTETGA